MKSKHLSNMIVCGTDYFTFGPIAYGLLRIVCKPFLYSMKRSA